LTIAPAIVTRRACITGIISSVANITRWDELCTQQADIALKEGSKETAIASDIDACFGGGGAGGAVGD
jgi:hypothetical protein